MELTEEQKAEVAGWVRDGAGLADVQKRISSDFDIMMTYMDVRFLVLDLNVDVVEEPDPEPEPEPIPEPEPVADVAEAAAIPTHEIPDEDLMPPEASPAEAANVTVEVDRLMKPGALVSGDVTFSDGKKGTWALDQMGRLALDMGGDKDYRPTEVDLQAFQQELRSSLERTGF